MRLVWILWYELDKKAKKKSSAWTAEPKEKSVGLSNMFDNPTIAYNIASQLCLTTRHSDHIISMAEPLWYSRGRGLTR